MSDLGLEGFNPGQRRAISHRASELAVSAAAGSGKTKVLIERLCHRLLGVQSSGQVDPGRSSDARRLLVVTFTNKAAAELRARLAARLAELANASGLEPAARRRAAEQLMLLPSASIGTIHSFCSRVIGQYGVLADLQPGRLLDEAEALLIEHQLATEFLDRRLDGSDQAVTELALAYGGPDGVGGEDLSRGGRGMGRGLRRYLLDLTRFRRSLLDPAAWLAEQSYPPLDPQHCAAGHPLVIRVMASFGEWLETELAAQALEAGFLRANCPEADQLVALAVRRGILDRARHASWNEVAALLMDLDRKLDGTGGLPKVRGNRTILGGVVDGLPPDSACRAVIEAGRKRFAPRVKEWRELFATPWASVALRENAASAHTATLWRLAGEYEVEFASYKRQRGLRDFSDLERDCLALLGDSRVALALRSQFDEVLIDEYQDTNELQDALLSRITPSLPGSDARARFVVGDLKQSIYAFRLAEPELFQRLCVGLGSGPAEQGIHQRLNMNYRSRLSVVEAVNAIFHGLLTSDFGGEDYASAALEYGADYAAWGTADLAAPPDCRARLHLVLEARSRAEDGEVEAEAEAGSEEPGGEDAEQPQPAGFYRRIAAVLREIRDGGQLIFDKEQKRYRPAGWGDMVVLLRSRTGMLELREALTAAEVPFTAEGRSGFYERPEIADILSLLAVLDNPLQDIPLAAVLRGPAVGLAPAELLEVAQSQPIDAEARLEDDGEHLAESGPRLWRRLLARAADPQHQDELAGRLREFAMQIGRWQQLARVVALPELVWRLMAEAGLLIASAALRGGEQRCANLLAFHDLALRFGSFEQQGLARFLEYIRLHRRAAGDLGEADPPGGGSGQVRVLTVHQAKGLEFPVVVLALPPGFNEQGLRRDLLWHKRSGLGAVHLDLRDPQPRRWKTLAYRQAAGLKRRGMLEEELRILYVALTRARERLEVVAALKPNALDQSGQWAAAPVQARSMWQWLRVQLQSQITRAGSPALEADAWEVLVHRAEPDAPIRPAEAASLREAPASLDAALRLATAPYAGPAGALPYKLTVTELAKRRWAAGDEADADADAPAVWRPEGATSEPGEQSAIRPGRLDNVQMPGAAGRGSLWHAALHWLSRNGRLRADCAEVDAQAALAAAGAALGMAAGSGTGEAARLAAEVQALLCALPLAECRLHSEVPLSAAFHAGELRSLGLEHPTLPADAAGMVVVQGTLDLLIQRPDGSALVLDFKTDRISRAEELLQRYSAQLRLYKELVRRLLPGVPVSWALYGLETVRLVGPYAE